MAVFTTKQENHITFNGIQNSLILKRFLYEQIFRFTPLCYIAFIQLDIQALKDEMILLFAIDEIRRVTTETIIPFICKWIATFIQDKSTTFTIDTRRIKE